MRPPMRGRMGEGGRAKARTLPIAPSPRPSSPLLSPESFSAIPPPSSLYRDARFSPPPTVLPRSNSPERLTSNQSSPGHPTFPFPPHLAPNLSAASCPSSPLPPPAHLAETSRVRLPLQNSHAVRASAFPFTPLSPEVHTVALPIMTPSRGSDASASGSEVSARGWRSERNRMSGSTMVSDEGGNEGVKGIEDGEGQEGGVDLDIEIGIEEQAKVDRKVCCAHLALFTADRQDRSPTWRSPTLAYSPSIAPSKVFWIPPTSADK